MAAAPPPLDLAGGAEDLTVVPSALTVAQLQVGEGRGERHYYSFTFFSPVFLFPHAPPVHCTRTHCLMPP